MASHKILKSIVAVGLMLVPMSAGATSTIAWISSSTPSSFIQPNLVNGVAQAIIVNGTATSTINKLRVGSLEAPIFSSGVCTGNAFSVDTPTFVVDCTNHRIGVGTTTPSQALEIHTTANAGGLAISGTDDNVLLYLRNYDTGGTTWNLNSTGGAAGTGQGKLTFSSVANANVMTLSGSNVGIGTTTPFGLLSVNPNNMGTAPYFVVGSSTATTLNVEHTKITAFGTTTTDQFGFGSTRYVGISGGGAVYWDSAAQDATLSVTGSGLTIGVGGAASATNNRISIKLATVNSSFSLSQDVATFLPSNNGTLLLGGGTATDNSNGRLQLAASTNSNAGIGFGSDVTIYRSNTATLNVTGSTTFAGIVGIGTTSPSQRLALQVSTNNDGMVIDAATTGNPAYKLNVDSALKGFFGAARIASDIFTGSTAGAVAIRTQGTDFMLGTNSANAPALTVTAVTGNVGIGTTTPQAKLHVFGTYPVARFDRDAAAASGRFTASLLVSAANSNSIADGFGSSQQFGIQNLSGTLSILGSMGALRDGADNSGALVFASSLSGTETERMRITAAGNVGVGTTTANRKLVVQGDAYLATSTPAADTGLLLVASDGSCHRLVVSSINVVSASTVTCP